jgi:hypothetical protein
MLASAAYFVVKTMVEPAAGTSSATASRVPARPAADHDAPDTIGTYGSRPSAWKRLFAAVRGGTAGVPDTGSGEGRRRLGGTVQAD